MTPGSAHNDPKDDKIANNSHIETLLDWLMEVWGVYYLHKETFHLAEGLLDHFLSVAPPVPTSRLQLVGMTCFFMSCGVEESSPPSLEELAYLTDGACTAEEIQQLETIISRCLDGGRISFEDLRGLRWGPE